MGYNLDNVTVLIVEDNLPILELTKSILQTFGIRRVFSATNGKDAFKVFCEEIPDIVITDMVMKPVNGIELTRKIRTDSRSPDPYVPIILITAFSEKTRILEARDEGVTEFLVKPFNARDLYRRIAQVIENPRKFVRAKSFFGPDRRRSKDKPYEGPLRRKTDVLEEDYKQWQTTQLYRENTKKSDDKR